MHILRFRFPGRYTQNVATAAGVPFLQFDLGNCIVQAMLPIVYSMYVYKKDESVVLLSGVSFKVPPFLFLFLFLPLLLSLPSFLPSFPPLPALHSSLIPHATNAASQPRRLAARKSS